MSETVINLMVIVIVVGTIALALYTYQTNKKRKAGSASSEKVFTDWLEAQGFAPEYMSWFAGTGIAMKTGDNRMAFQSRGVMKFCPLSDITAIHAHQTTASARPLGAAPGVVEVRQFQLFNLDISVKNGDAPVRVLMENDDQMRQWEQRLKAAAGI